MKYNINERVAAERRQRRRSIYCQSRQSGAEEDRPGRCRSGAATPAQGCAQQHCPHLQIHLVQLHLSELGTNKHCGIAVVTHAYGAYDFRQPAVRRRDFELFSHCSLFPRLLFFSLLLFLIFFIACRYAIDSTYKSNYSKDN